MSYNDKLRLPDLMRQGFMKPRREKRVSVPRETVACDDCLNWHAKGKHTVPISVRRARHKERVQDKARKKVMLLLTPEGESSFEDTLFNVLRANKDDEWVKEELLKLRPGQSVQLGGGAQPGFVVKRVRSKK